MGRFIVEYRVPWSDVDLAGVVYFPRFLRYFEMAELEWVREQGYGYEEFLRRLNVWLPRVAVHCNYRAPVRLDDRLVIEMGLSRIGRRSFTLEYQAFRMPDRHPVADGYTVIATVSRARFKPVVLPRFLRTRLEKLKTRHSGDDAARAGANALSPKGKKM